MKTQNVCAVVSMCAMIVFGVSAAWFSFNANRIMKSEFQPIIQTEIEGETPFLADSIDVVISNCGHPANNITIQTVTFFELLCPENNMGIDYRICTYINEDKECSLNIYSGKELWSGDGIEYYNHQSGKIAKVSCLSGVNDQIKKVASDVSSLISQNASTITTWYATYNTLICVHSTDALSNKKTSYFLLRTCSPFDTPVASEEYYTLNDLEYIPQAVGDSIYKDSQEAKRVSIKNITGKSIVESALKIIRDKGIYKKGYNGYIVWYGEYEPYGCNFAN